MGITFHPFDSNKPVRIYRRRLPHWRQDGATYFVTFREHDSLPSHLVEQLSVLREGLLRNGGNSALYLEADREYFRRMKQYLQAGHGACRLRHAPAARVLKGTFAHFDGVRYELGEHKVMANHAHVLVRPLEGFELDDILHSWKSYSANKINEIVNGRGRVWQDESYDRLVRNSEEFRNTEQYIKGN